MLVFYSGLFLIVVLVEQGVADAQFGQRVPQGQVHANVLEEASGAVLSRVHPNVLYTHNDKGDSSRFFAIDIQSGDLLATFTVKRAQNYDWEDITYGPCVDDCLSTPCSASARPSRYCIYIADIGDHGGDGAKDIIYMLREPATIADAEVDIVDSLQFSWTEIDAETLMISPAGNLYVISKIDGGQGVLAELPTSAWGQSGVFRLDMSNTATLKISTGKNDPQGGDISPNGQEVLIVAEEGAYYISVPDGNYINAVRSIVPQPIQPYKPEPSTESIAWAPDGKGFYVLAEGSDPTIFFYPRLDDDSIVG